MMNTNPYAPPRSNSEHLHLNGDDATNNNQGQCSKCGQPLEYNYLTPICQRCYAQISSTEDLPEIEDSLVSRNTSLLSFLILLASNLLSSLAPALVILGWGISAFFAIIAIIFFFMARNRVTEMEIRSHKYSKVGLVIGTVSLLYCVLILAMSFSQIK